MDIFLINYTTIRNQFISVGFKHYSMTILIWWQELCSDVVFIIEIVDYYTCFRMEDVWVTNV